MVEKKLYAIIFMISIFFSSIPELSSLQLEESNDMIVNDVFWKDTNGNNIYSQGGGIFKFGDTYYWYGVHYKGAETYAASLTKKTQILPLLL